MSYFLTIRRISSLSLLFVGASLSQSKQFVIPTIADTFSLSTFGQGQVQTCFPADYGNLVLAGNNVTTKYSLSGNLLWQNFTDTEGVTGVQQLACFPDSNAVIQTYNNFTSSESNILESFNMSNGKLNWSMNLDPSTWYLLTPWQARILLFRSNVGGVNTTCHVLDLEGKELSTFPVDRTLLSPRLKFSEINFG